MNAGLRTTAEEMKVSHFWSFSADAHPPEKGWNHVKLTMPSPDPEPYACRHAWCMTFVPVLGTSAHPREVPGLEYRSEP